MKRSRINKAIKEMEALAAAHGFALPDFCKWTPGDWQNKGAEYDEIRDNMLGWDITDFGSSEYDRVGFALVTLRNGNLGMNQYKKPYAEKLLMLNEGQYALMHFHWSKMEDIINRGGGNICIRVYNSLPDGDMDKESDVTIYSDGRSFAVAAGTQVRLTPGNSITIMQGMYHDFSVEPGTGAVLLGEVSMVNDDANDNRFFEPAGRFPAIEEDEPPYRLLCNEYPKAI